MEKLITTTHKVVEAIKEYALSINASDNGIGDMTTLVNATSELELKNIVYWERLIREELENALNNSAPPKWKQWLKPKRKLHWLDIISWNGYERESSLRSLSGGAPNAFFLVLLIRRLNDWVPQVRKSTREVLPLIIKNTTPEYISEILSVVLLNWNSWGRIEEEDKQLLLRIINTEDLAIPLKFKLISSVSGPMPSLLSQLGRTSILDTHLDDIANNSIQPYVRAKAFRSLFEERMTWIEGRKWQLIDKVYGERELIPIIGERKIEVQTPFIELLNRSAADRSAIVRQVSAEFVIRNIESLGNHSRFFAEKFAADKSNSVSEQGKFILKKLEEKP